MLAYGKSHKRIIPKPAKLPDSITTVEDLLADDTVNDILAEVQQAKPNIKDLIVIYIDHNDKLRYLITRGSMNTDVVWALEYVKKDQLEDSEE